MALNGVSGHNPLGQILLRQIQKKPRDVGDSSTLVGKGFLSDTHGKIKHILVSSFYSSTAKAIKLFGGKQKLMEDFLRFDYRRIESLLKNTDSDVKVTILHQGDFLFKKADPNLLGLRKKFGKRVNIINLNFQPPLWIQDRLLVFKDKTVFVRTSDPETDERFKVEGLPNFRFGIEHLGKLGFKVITSPMGVFNMMREGDMLVSDKFIFLGPRTLTHTYKFQISKRNEARNGMIFLHIDGKEETVIDQFSKKGELKGGLQRYAEILIRDLEMVDGKRKVIIPYLSGHPAFFDDLDMVFTPLWEKNVVVADPSLSGDVARKFISEGFNYVKPGTKKDPMEETQFKQQELDGIAWGLSNLGFKVDRIPILNRMERGDEVIPWCSYNNVQLEIFGNKKRVYMPVYGIPELDNMAAGIYGGLGFEVKRIKGMNEVAKSLGSFRCSSKVLERSG